MAQLMTGPSERAPKGPESKLPRWSHAAKKFNKSQQIRGPGRMVKLTLTLTADDLSANRQQFRIFPEGFVKET
jgi:hypothetical protein